MCVLTISCPLIYTSVARAMTSSVTVCDVIYHKLTSVITGHNYVAFKFLTHCARVYKDEEDVYNNVEFDLCNYRP